MTHLVASALRGDWTTARQLNRRFYPLMKTLFLEPSPAPVKVALQLIGHAEETLRLPLVPVSNGTREVLEAVIDGLGLLRDLPVRESNLIVL